MKMSLAECARIVGGRLQGVSTHNDEGTAAVTQSADNATAAATEATELSFSVVETDSRRLQPGALFVALHGPNHNGHDYVLAAYQAQALAAIVSEPVEITGLPVIQVNDTLRALQTLAQHIRMQSAAKVAAITGSCGKTSCRAFVESIFHQHGQPFLATRKSYNNAIGVPLTLCRLAGNEAYMVLELGANHPGEIAMLTHLVKPHVSLILNAAPVHLEGFGDVAGVACAKGEIFQGLEADGVAILNRDDHYFEFWQRQVTGRKILSFGMEHGADISATEVHLDHNLQVNFKLHAMAQVADINLKFLGEHNVYNALAAAAVALAMQIPFADVVAGLQHAAPQPGRLNRYQLPSNITLIDDTYNSNPQAMASAIDLIAQSARDTILVAGDMAELGDDAVHYHRQVGEKARDLGIKKLYAVGVYAKHMVDAFGGGAKFFKNQAALIAALHADLKPDDLVLLKASRGAHLEHVVTALRGE